jgi:methyl-accepting chemotaxis protein
MGRIRAYFGRIQGRLWTAFGIGFVGTSAIFALALISMNSSDRVMERLDALQQRMDLAVSLEAAIVDEINAAQQYVLAPDSGLLAEFDSLAARAGRLHVQYQELGDFGESDLSTLTAIRSRLSELEREVGQARVEVASGNSGVAVARISALTPGLRELRALVRILRAAEGHNAVQTANDFRTAAASQKQMMLGVGAVSIIIALIFFWFALQAIQRPLQRLVDAANQLGTGDLRVSVDGRMPDELGVLAGAFTGMAERLRRIVGETVETANRITASASDLSSVSEEVAASSGEVSTAMIDITSGAEEQAHGLRSVDEALQHMQTRARDIDEAAAEVRDLGTQIGALAEAKRIDIRRAIGLLLEVREVVRSTGTEVNALQQASEKVTIFVEIIQGIARQTNLLALNAAIEAARAGEHGRGFAVVADEVRKLADGSARAADEVSATVHGIREQIRAVTNTIDAGYDKVAGVEEASKGADAAFEEIVTAVARVRDAAARVASAAEENRNATVTVDEHVRAVGATAESHAASAEQVSAAAQEQSAATEELSAASVELLNAAEKLKDLVSEFRT